MGSQQAVAGGGTSKSGGSTDKAIHAILSSSLTHVLQLLSRYHALDAHTPNFHTAAISRFPIFLIKFFIIFGLFLFIFFNLIFFILAGWPNFFTASLNCIALCCSVLQLNAVCCTWSMSRMWRASVLRSIVLQCHALCCSVLQCVAVCCTWSMSRMWRASICFPSTACCIWSVITSISNLNR